MVGEKKKGAVPGFVHREEHFVSDQPQLDWKKRRWQEGRESRGLREEQEERAVHPVSLLFCWVIFSGAAGCFACWVVECFVISSSFSPRPSRVEVKQSTKVRLAHVTPDRRTDGVTLRRTIKRNKIEKMISRHQDEVSLCLPYRQQDTAHSGPG